MSSNELTPSQELTKIGRFAFVLAVLAMVSCSNAKPPISRTDTLANYFFNVKWPGGTTSMLFKDTVIIKQTPKYVFTDTLHSTGGHWVIDTACFGRIVTDSLRDKSGKPLYDTAHKVLWSTAFYPIASPSHLLRNTIPDKY